MDKITKEKIKNLIALRNNYISLIMLTSTGIASLLILDLNAIKYIIFLALLFYFEMVFILKFEFTSNKIDNLLKGKGI